VVDGKAEEIVSVETEIEVLSAVAQTTEDSDVISRCFKQHAPSVTPRVKFRLNRMAASPCFAATVLSAMEALRHRDSAETETANRHLTAVLHRNHLSTDLQQQA